MSKKRPADQLIILLLGSLTTINPFAIDMYLPSFTQMAKDLGTTPARISLSITTYFIGIAVGQLFYGPLLDRFGRKKPLYYGLSIYILSCIGCMFSQNLSMLLSFRLIQALGGSVSFVAAMTMVRDFFPVEKSAKIISLLMLVLGLSPLLAPTIGGFVTTALGWQWVFAVLVIIVLLVVSIIFFFLPSPYKPDPTVVLKVKPMLSTFYTILKNSTFSTYSLAGAFSFATLFIYVAGSPLIFMELYHVDAQTYGLIFALLAGGFIGSNQVNVLLLRWFSSEQIFRRGLFAQLLTSIVFFTGALNGWFGLTGTIVMFFIALFCLGLTSPNASALALAPFTKNIGSASALIGSLQIGVAGLASACVGLFNASNTAPITAVIMATTFIAYLILLLKKKRAVPVVQREAELEGV